MEEVTYLLLTVATELPVALLLLPKREWKRVAFLVTCANMVTHPLAWAAVAHGVPWLLAELALALFEAGVFYLTLGKKPMAILVAVLMNAVSAAIGIFLF